MYIICGHDRINSPIREGNHKKRIKRTKKNNSSDRTRPGEDPVCIGSSIRLTSKGFAKVSTRMAGVSFAASNEIIRFPSCRIKSIFGDVARARAFRHPFSPSLSLLNFLVKNASRERRLSPNESTFTQISSLPIGVTIDLWSHFRHSDFVKRSSSRFRLTKNSFSAKSRTRTLRSSWFASK